VRASDDVGLKSDLQYISCSPQAEDQAWVIYQFFVAKDSAFEISINPKQREDIMRSLARPHLHTFRHLESAAKIELEIIFDGYKRNNKASYTTWESRAVAIALNIKKIEDQGGRAGRYRRWWKAQFAKKENKKVAAT
jgi:hypothetical protein